MRHAISSLPVHWRYTRTGRAIGGREENPYHGERSFAITRSLRPRLVPTRPAWENNVCAFLPLLCVIVFVLYLGSLDTDASERGFQRLLPSFIDNFAALFDVYKAQEELRKMGAVLMSAGGVALAINSSSNPIEPRNAATAILAGGTLVLIGAFRASRKQDEAPQ